MSQTTTYVEFLEQLQSEFLSSVKQAQANNLKALASFSEFTTQILEQQRAYAAKFVEIAIEAQKQFIEAETEAEKHQPTSTKAVIPATKTPVESSKN